MILKGAPPVVLTKYEFVHSVGNLRLSSGNSWRKKREEPPLISCTIGACLHDNLVQAFFDRPHQPLPSIFGTPNHMEVAREKHIPVAPISLNHCSNIQLLAI